MSLPSFTREKRGRYILIGLLALLIVTLPVLVYVAVSRQNLKRQAAFATATVNLTPISVTKPILDEFISEVYINSNSTPVSAVKIKLAIDTSKIQLTNVSGETGYGKPFTDLIYDPATDPHAFILVSKRPASELQSGNLKIAILTFKIVDGGSNVVGINSASSEVVGFNGTTATDVNLSVVQGTTIAVTGQGTLCSVNQCVPANSITLTELNRVDGKWNINLTWQPPQSGTNYIYKLYRSSGSPVPTIHPLSNFVSSVTTPAYLDTNNGAGFPSQSTQYYSIDSYIICP